MFTLSVIRSAQKEIMKLPVTLQAEMLSGLEILQEQGAFLREPVVRDLYRNGLKELRVRSQEGCAGGYFSFIRGITLLLCMYSIKRHRKHLNKY